MVNQIEEDVDALAQIRQGLERSYTKRNIGKDRAMKRKASMQVAYLSVPVDQPSSMLTCAVLMCPCFFLCYSCCCTGDEKHDTNEMAGMQQQERDMRASSIMLGLNRIRDIDYKNLNETSLKKVLKIIDWSTSEHGVPATDEEWVYMNRLVLEKANVVGYDGFRKEDLAFVISTYEVYKPGERLGRDRFVELVAKHDSSSIGNLTDDDFFYLLNDVVFNLVDWKWLRMKAIRTEPMLPPLMDDIALMLYEREDGIGGRAGGGGGRRGGGNGNDRGGKGGNSSSVEPSETPRAVATVAPLDNSEVSPATPVKATPVTTTSGSSSSSSSSNSTNNNDNNNADRRMSRTQTLQNSDAARRFWVDHVLDMDKLLHNAEGIKKHSRVLYEDVIRVRELSDRARNGHFELDDIYMAINYWVAEWNEERYFIDMDEVKRIERRKNGPQKPGGRNSFALPAGPVPEIIQRAADDAIRRESVRDEEFANNNRRHSLIGQSIQE